MRVRSFPSSEVSLMNSTSNPRNDRFAVTAAFGARVATFVGASVHRY